MPWAERLPSGRWRARYRGADGKLHIAPGGTCAREAEARRRGVRAEDEARRDPHAATPRDGRITWSQWRQLWEPLRAVSDGTASRDVTRLDRHLEPRWGNVALVDITRDDIQRWVLELQREPPDGPGLAAWTVRHCYNLLSSSLRAATVSTPRRLASSPCEGIRLPVPPEGAERFLTHDEVNRIAVVLREPYRTMVLLLVGSGLRWGEAAGLHWDRVDLDDGSIDVVDVWDDKIREMRPYPKSRRSRRVWIPDWLVAELDRHQATQPTMSRCAAPHRRDSRCRSGLVIPGVNGAAMGLGSFRRRHWAVAVGTTRWVLPDGREYPTPSEARRVKDRDGEPEPVWRDGIARIGPARIHDLRHTFASWALQADPPMPIHDLAVAMGHSTTRVTASYGHLARSSRDRFRTAMAWPGATPPPSTAPGAAPGRRQTPPRRTG